MKVLPGLYKHFNGHIYRVIGVAKHSENLEEHVVYVSVNNPENMWVRPVSMFLDVVERDGQSFQRFEPIEHSASQTSEASYLPKSPGYDKNSLKSVVHPESYLILQEKET